MMRKSQKYFGKFRQLFLSVVFIAVGITVALYYNSRGPMSKSEKAEMTVSEGSYLSIRKLKQTLMTEGRKAIEHTGLGSEEKVSRKPTRRFRPANL